ncbi:MAG: lysozyme [Alphaproteobacteria bacterium]|nr:lysozyme [Alphaproteobacteria bacterium]
MKRISEIKKIINNLKNKYGLASALTLATMGGIVSSNSSSENETKSDKKEVLIKQEKSMSFQEKSDGILMSILVMIEGCTLKAYTDDIGVWTYGIGNTKTIEGKAVKQGDTLKNNQEAYAVAEHHIKERIDYVFDHIKRDLSPEQKAALSSFMYNCGAGTLVKDERLTELGQAINEGNDDYVVKEMLKYNKAGGSFMRGLFTRRILEAYVYQGLITIDELQACPIGGLGNISCSDEMMKVFGVKLSKYYVGGKNKKWKKYKVKGTYDDTAITNYSIAKKFIEICQQPIDGPISKKLADFNLGKPICDFLPENLLATNAKSFNTQQEAGPNLDLVKIYKNMKNTIEQN